MPPPILSVIMPVFNTGPYLIEAVDSILRQRPRTAADELPPYELIVIDDRSTDTVTLEILTRLPARDPRILVLQNQRSKGAAGARNTGIEKAQGVWIAFLDSDDIWFEESLALRWQIVQENGADVRWVASRFAILRAQQVNGRPVGFEPAAELLAKRQQPAEPPPLLVKRRPVEDFARECFTGLMTVLIRKDLLEAKGMFDERLQRAEDYQLWFLCAFDQDLYFLNDETAYYRIHSASLTHGRQPKYLYEDRMIAQLLQKPQAAPFRKLLLQRLDIVMQDHCYFYRANSMFLSALQTACKWIVWRPHRLSAWKELLAGTLRVS